MSLVLVLNDPMPQKNEDVSYEIGCEDDLNTLAKTPFFFGADVKKSDQLSQVSRASQPLVHGLSFKVHCMLNNSEDVPTGTFQFSKGGRNRGVQSSLISCRISVRTVTNQRTFVNSNTPRLLKSSEFGLIQGVA